MAESVQGLNVGSQLGRDIGAKLGNDDKWPAAVDHGRLLCRREVRKAGAERRAALGKPERLFRVGHGRPVPGDERRFDDRSETHAPPILASGIDRSGRVRLGTMLTGNRPPPSP